MGKRPGYIPTERECVVVGVGWGTTPCESVAAGRGMPWVGQGGGWMEGVVWGGNGASGHASVCARCGWWMVNGCPGCSVLGRRRRGTRPLCSRSSGWSIGATSLCPSCPTMVRVRVLNEELGRRWHHTLHAARRAAARLGTRLPPALGRPSPCRPSVAGPGSVGVGGAGSGRTGHGGGAAAAHRGQHPLCVCL